MEQQGISKALGSQPPFEPVARRRRKAEPELPERVRRDRPILEVLTDASSGDRLELFPEIYGRDLVHLQQRLAQPGIRRALALPFLGKRDAELLRQHSNGFLKADLLVELQELEDVPAHVAPETVKEPLLWIDVKRRRLFAVKRAESFVGAPRSLERHIFLHDLQDVGLQTKVVDELLRKQHQGNCRFVNL